MSFKVLTPKTCLKFLQTYKNVLGGFYGSLNGLLFFWVLTNILGIEREMNVKSQAKPGWDGVGKLKFRIILKTLNLLLLNLFLSRSWQSG